MLSITLFALQKQNLKKQKKNHRRDNWLTQFNMWPSKLEFSVLILVNWNYLITGKFSSNFMIFRLHNVCNQGRTKHISSFISNWLSCTQYTAQKMKFSIKDFYSCDQICSNCEKRVIDRSLTVKRILKSYIYIYCWRNRPNEKV